MIDYNRKLSNERETQVLSHRVAGQLGLKSSRPLSQLSPGSTRSESTRPGVFSERIWYMFCFLYMYNHSD